MKKIIKQLNMLPALLVLAFVTSQSANAATLSLESAGGLSNFTVTQGVEFDLVVKVTGATAGVSAGAIDVTWLDPNIQFNSFAVNPAMTVFPAGDLVSNPNASDGIQYAGANFDLLTGLPDPTGDFVFATLKFTVIGALMNNSATFNLADFYLNNGWLDSAIPANDIIFSSVSNVTISAVPVPPALLLFGSSLLGLIGVNRRRKLA